MSSLATNHVLMLIILFASPFDFVACRNFLWLPSFLMLACVSVCIGACPYQEEHDGRLWSELYTFRSVGQSIRSEETKNLM